MPATPSKMRMFGSFQRLVSILFRKNGYDQTLLPNQTISYTADRVIELPEVDLDCVLISEAQVADNYQPLSAELTAIAGLGAGIVVNDGASGAFARAIEADVDGGIYVSNQNGVDGNPGVKLSLANLQSETATLSDKMIFGDVSASDAPKYLTIQDLADLIVPEPVVSGKYFSWSTGDTKTCEHNFGTKNVMVQIYDNDGRTVYVDNVLRSDTNTVILSALGFENPVTGPWTVLITSGAGFVAG